MNESCKITAGNYTLSFEDLYVDNDRIYGGELDEEDILKIGSNEFPVEEVYFYYDSYDIIISLWLETPKSKLGISYLFYYKPFGHEVRFF